MRRTTCTVREWKERAITIMCINHFTPPSHPALRSNHPRLPFYVPVVNHQRIHQTANKPLAQTLTTLGPHCKLRRVSCTSSKGKHQWKNRAATSLNLEWYKVCSVAATKIHEKTEKRARKRTNKKLTKLTRSRQPTIPIVMKSCPFLPSLLSSSQPPFSTSTNPACKRASQRASK